ncbi:MAG: hypothetical protein KAH96_03880 [Alphaproteobacteria bacterium]|nr:hypothetical protein [Alphaproteobacteria bacterium]
MPKNIKSLRLPIQKVMALGKIDRQLRSISEVTPRFLDTADKPASTFMYDPYKHTINYTFPIKIDEITKMVGFQRLLNACFEKDVMITIEASDAKTLNIQFEPTSHFSKSSVLIPVMKIQTKRFHQKPQPFRENTVCLKKRLLESSTEMLHISSI